MITTVVVESCTPHKTGVAQSGRAWTLYKVVAQSDLTEELVSFQNLPLGELTVEAKLSERQYGNKVYRSYQLSLPREKATVTEIGVYELPTGEIYVVKQNKAKTGFYANRLVEINGERLTEADSVVEIEFEYERGAIMRIKPEHKMDVERAKELTIRYGRCIVCGKRLKAAESVERGIGPVCIKSFAPQVRSAPVPRKAPSVNPAQLDLAAASPEQLAAIKAILG